MSRFVIPSVLAATFAVVMSAQEPAAEQFTSPLKVSKGQVLWYLNSLRIDQAMGMDAGAFEFGIGIDVELSFTVADVKEDGSAMFDVKVTRVKGSVSSPMTGDSEFDSAKPASDDDEDMLMGATKAIVGMADKSFTIEVDGKGKFVKSEGINKLMRGRGGPMGGGFTSQTVENVIRDLFVGLAAEPAAVGTSWDQMEDVSALGFSLPTKGKRVFEKVTPDAFEIGYKGSAGEIDPKTMAGGNPQANALLESLDLGDTSLEKSWKIGRKDGLLQHGKSKTSVVASMASPMGEGEMTMELTSTTETKRIEGSSVPKTESKPTSQPAATGETK